MITSDEEAEAAIEHARRYGYDNRRGDSLGFDDEQVIARYYEEKTRGIHHAHTWVEYIAALEWDLRKMYRADFFWNAVAERRVPYETADGSLRMARGRWDVPTDCTIMEFPHDLLRRR